MSAPLVEVLLATYDGERYLAEQLDSVLGQTHPRVRVLARDDGSSDGTVALLRGYEGERLRVVEGAPAGVPAAFFELLDLSGDDADLWALCDQDDVWLPDKLARAVAALDGVEGPAMACGRVLVVDEQLRPLYPHELPHRGPSFANALVQNIALGCTVVLNRAARDVVRAGGWPRDCVMHDAWLYLVVAGTGTVLYDTDLLVHYRQHGRNTVGMGRGPVSRLRGRVQRQLSPDGAGKHSRQDRELLRLHGDRLTPRARAELEAFLAAQGSAGWRLAYALRGPAHRQTRGSDVVLKALQVLGRV